MFCLLLRVYNDTLDECMVHPDGVVNICNKFNSNPSNKNTSVNVMAVLEDHRSQ